MDQDHRRRTPTPLPRPTTQPSLVQDDGRGLQPDPHHRTRHPTSHRLTATSRPTAAGRRFHHPAIAEERQRGLSTTRSAPSDRSAGACPHPASGLVAATEARGIRTTKCTMTETSEERRWTPRRPSRKGSTYAEYPQRMAGETDHRRHDVHSEGPKAAGRGRHQIATPSGIRFDDVRALLEAATKARPNRCTRSQLDGVDDIGEPKWYGQFTDAQVCSPYGAWACGASALRGVPRRRRRRYRPDNFPTTHDGNRISTVGRSGGGVVRSMRRMALVKNDQSVRTIALTEPMLELLRTRRAQIAETRSRLGRVGRSHSRVPDAAGPTRLPGGVREVARSHLQEGGRSGHPTW